MALAPEAIFEDFMERVTLKFGKSVNTAGPSGIDSQILHLLLDCDVILSHTPLSRAFFKNLAQSPAA
jgi:hypothetical protein